jgi:hypothetical protein
MPDNDKIQLPKGFKLDELDESIETPIVKLPKGFTLDTEVVKKKVGGEESSLTKSQLALPDFEKGKAFAEKGFLMQPEGTKSPKEVKVEPVEKQGLILNTISSLDKSFAKNLISSPIKAFGTALQGVTKKAMGGTGEGFVSDNLIKFGDYLNKTIDELTPQDEEFKGTLIDQVAQAFGQVGSLVFTGGITGAAGKGAALVSQVPKGSAAATAAKTLGSQLASPTAVSAGLSMGQAEFDRAIEAGANNDQAFEAFYKNAAVGSVLETIPVMQFFKRFNNTTGGSVANYIKTKGVAGLTGGIEEMTTEVLQQIYSNKTAKDIYNINQDILDGVGTSGGIGFGVGFVLNAMGANAKILRKEGKQKEADVLENQIKQYEDNLENPKVTSGNKVSAKDIVTQGVEIGTQKAVKNLDRDLANNVITPEQYEEGVVFAEKAAQVADKIPETVTGESRAKSIELLVERNDINQANQNLIQQKQNTDVAYHAGIDEEIKANEERIKKLDSEVYNIAKKPSKEFGGKKYIVDGEEVSQAEFEALQEKPVGTKKIIKAEVKPTEVEVTEEVKPIEVKRIVEPSKAISEMNSEELDNFATETRKALKRQDRDFEGKTEKEKEDGGYYDVIDEVEDLRDASERISFIENAENVNDLANSVKSTLSNIKGKEPDEYQLAILNAAKNKAIELNIDTKDLIKNISFKIENQYEDVEDAKLMVKSALEKLILPQEVKPTEAKQPAKKLEAKQKVSQPELAPVEPPKKTYQEAVKEKLEADKKRNREAGAERATVTKEIYRRVDQMDAPADAEQVALRYLADGGKVSKQAVDEAYGSVKRAELNVKRRVSLSEEVKSKDFVQGNETLDQTAHRLWEANKQKIPESEIKDKLMAEIGNTNSRLEAAEAYLDKYNAEYKLEKEEMRLAELYKEQYLEEQAEIEKELRKPLDEQIEGEATEEHINNLINQYEAEIKGQDQQLRPESEGDVSKEAGKGKVAEKTSETELAKEYKEATGKASKKAKENAKKDFVERNFDNIVEKLKIQIKCPT